MTETTTGRSDTGRSPTGLASHPGCNQVPLEQFRLALVLNGGVSLAVWMGGVALEVDRLTKADPTGTSPYDLLLRLSGCSARSDIITGTSAGGINGAAIALGQVNRHADLGLLRDLWTDQGRFDALLRTPFQGQPTSLLKGDDYFLPQLTTALGILADPRQGWVDARTAPIDLTITTTVLAGNQAVSVDAMGQQLPQSIHAGRFRWERYPTDGSGRPGYGPPRDPFATEAIEETAKQLALACRATASFPTAFEPCFIPVGRRTPTGTADPRPDMRHVVTSWGTKGDDTDRSKFVIDGGVLANTPTRAALDAIARMPDEGPVRRVMLLVFPHAPAPGDDPPAAEDEPPTLTEAMSGVLGALTAQGSRTYVEELERHNLAAAGRRGTRSDVLRELEEPGGLETLSDTVYPHYVRLRRWQAARDLAAWRTGSTALDDVGNRNLPTGWAFERVRVAAEKAQEAWTDPERGMPHELPYASRRHPLADNVAGTGWGWGLRGARGVADAVADLLRRLVAVVHRDDFESVAKARSAVSERAAEIRGYRSLTDTCWQASETLTRLAPNETYWKLRLACFDHLMLGNVTRRQVDEHITAAVESNQQVIPRDGGQPHPITAEDVQDALRETLDRGPASAGRLVRTSVEQILEAIRPVLPLLTSAVVDGNSELDRWRKVVFPEKEPARLPSRVMLARLLQLEVVSTALGEEVTTGAAQPVELVQISAQTTNPFARHTRSAADKLGGDAMARFGGFLKRSWRVNDWIWGRVDAATVLSTTLLDPKRLRRTARLSGYVAADTTREDASTRARATVDEVASLLPQVPEAEVARHQEAAVAALTDVFDLSVPEGDLPSALPDLAALFAWALHLDAVPQELPALAQAIRADHVDGANSRSRGELFVEEHGDLLRRLGDAGGAPTERARPEEPSSPEEPPPSEERPSREDRLRSLEAFDRAGIGREPLRDEATSDLLIRTSASTAAVVTTVADSDRSGLKAIKPVTRVLRGGMLLPYWAIWGLTSKSPLARTLAMLGFAVGGVVLALAMFGVLPQELSAPGAALGAGTVLAAFAYGAARTGSLLHSTVLLTPLIPLAVYAVDRSGAANELARERAVTGFVVVVLLALALMLLGSIRVATGTVWSALDAVADRVQVRRSLPPWPRRFVGVALLTGNVLLVVAVAAAAVGMVRWSVGVTPIEFVQRHRLVTYGAAVLLVVIAGVMADRCGRWLQQVRLDSDGVGHYAPLTNAKATAAGWSVLYGFGYLVVAVGVTLLPVPLDEWLWGRTVFATAVAFAVVLLLVVPVYLPVRALRETIVEEERRAAASAHAETDTPGFIEDLIARGSSYRWFVTLGTGRTPQLTKAGGRLERRVADARTAARQRTAR